MKPGFQVLVGSAPTLWPSFAVGAAGAVLAYANAAPYSTITIWEAHRTRDTEAARDWQNRIARAAVLVTVKYGIPGLKYAMDLNGYYGGPPRLPLLPPLYSLRLLPFIVPNIETWKRRVLREREFSDSDEFDMHGI